VTGCDVFVTPELGTRIVPVRVRVPRDISRLTVAR
jgi:hypothetical protein